MAMPSTATPAVRHVARDVAALLVATLGTASVIAGVSAVVGTWS